MGACILVVDDEARNRRLLQRFLEPCWDVAEAASGAEALRVLDSRPVDLVLLDVMMPGQDGFETCRLIQARPRGEFLPVILVTALGTQEDRNHGLESGASDFLQKPVDRRELLLRVGNFLRLRDQERLIRSQMEALRKLQAFKDDMASLLIHDLRSPLSGIVCGVEMALEDAKDEQLRQDLTRALHSAETLSAALDETLQVRLLEESAVVARREERELAAVVEAAVERLEPLARRRRIRLVSTLSGNATAPIDARLVQRALENLVSNALKYAPAASQIETCVRNRRGSVEIEVCDRGPGIPDPLKGVLFERFGSVEAHRAKERRGVGLGLYLVKLVAVAHDGDVAAEDRPGGGTIFRFRLSPPRTIAGSAA